MIIYEYRGVVEQAGAWLAYNTYKWQGKDKAKLALHADPDLRTELEAKIRAIISGDVFETPAPPEEPEEKIKENDKPARKKRVAKSQGSVS